MVRADNAFAKVHYKGEHEDYVVIVESAEAVQKWKADSSIPLVDVVNSFDVFVTNKHGAQGQLDRASNNQLENEFNTSKEDEVVKKILQDGSIQESKAQAKQGGRNESNGPQVASGGFVHG